MALVVVHFAGNPGSTDVPRIPSQAGVINRRIFRDNIKGTLSKLVSHRLQKGPSYLGIMSSKIHGATQDHDSGINGVDQGHNPDP